MRLVFMGTPSFAVPSLQELLDAGHEVAAVFSQPDRPQGRHFVLTPPPVKLLAQIRGVDVYQPESLRGDDTKALIKRLAPELIAVAAYAKSFRRVLLAIPPRGCLNVHASLLPKYRGAAPIQRAVINNETVTGVTIMQMAEGLDTGDILLQKTLGIGPDETAGELFERLAYLGAGALCETLDKLGSLRPVPQDEARATWAAPLRKEDGALDFSQSAAAVYARIRGVTPWPGAFATLGGKRLKILAAKPSPTQGCPGVLLDSKRLIVGCAEQSLELIKVQLAGAKPISGEELIRGQRLMFGELLFEKVIV
jgi:methionyl-tRNA formyltransferase